MFWEAECLASSKPFDFDADPYKDPDAGIFLAEFSPPQEMGNCKNSARSVVLPEVRAQ